MPPPDMIHNSVKRALIRDGWTITADPFTISYEEITLFADLAAERPLAAERGNEKIVVEVKSFVGRSPVNDLKLALGQFVLYAGFLEISAPDHKLYLAVSDTVYSAVFEQKAVQVIVRRYRLPVIVVNIDTEEIVAWKD